MSRHVPDRTGIEALVSSLYRAAQRLPRPARIALLTALYYAAAQVGLWQGHVGGNVAAVWPAAGLGLAALFVLGPGAWPGIAAGSFAFNLTSGVSAGPAVGMTTASTFEVVLAFALLRRCGFRPALDCLRDVGTLFALGAVVPATVATPLGAALVGIGGDTEAGYLEIWRTWWLGDVTGILVVAPFLLAAGAGTAPAGERPGGGTARASRLATAVGVVLLVAVSYVAFGTGPAGPALVFPLVGLVAIRRPARDTGLAVLVVATVALLRAGHDDGPFADLEPTAALLSLAAVLGILALTELALCAVVSERDRARHQLWAANRDLEARVAERTAALAEDRGRLAEAQRIAHIGSWEWLPATGAVTLSEEMYRIFGRSPGDAVSYALRRLPRPRSSRRPGQRAGDDLLLHRAAGALRLRPPRRPR